MRSVRTHLRRTAITAVTAVVASLLIATASAQAAVAAPVQSTAVVAAAASTGSINGVISQSKAGKTVPLANASVTLFEVVGSSRTWTRSVGTDAKGKFSLTGIGAGTYTIGAQPGYGSDLARQWWGNKGTLAGGSTFTIAGGKTLARNMTLVVGAKISGTAKSPSGATAKPIWANAIDSTGQYAGSAMTTASGSYVIKGLPAGSYKVQFNDYASPSSTHEPLVSEWWDNQPTAAKATAITVKAGATAAGKNAVLEFGGRISGTVTQSVGGVVKPVQYALVEVLSTSGTVVQSIAASETGKYEAYGLKAGSYKVRVSPGRWNPDYSSLKDTYWPSSSTLAGGSTVAVVAKKAKTGVNFKYVVTPKVTLATPTVTGTLKVGATLKAAAKSSQTGVTLGYQWYASGTKISGATKSSLVLASAQAGKAITVKVTGAKPAYTSVTTTSAASAKIVTSAIPTITGTAKVGATLTAKPGAWTTGVKLAYQWYANGAAISGATGSAFVVTTAQAAKAVTVGVTSAQAGYAAVTEKSTTSVKPARTAVPTITGTAKVGATLTATPGTWTTGTTLKYQWYAANVAISGATKPALLLSSAHVGKAITVKVSGSLTGYTTFTETAKATAKPLASAIPTISGTAKVGKTLTAVPGVWTSGVKLAYQWHADGAAISGATGTTFDVMPSYMGKALTVAVSSDQAGYAAVTEKSTPTQKAARTSAPTIAGTAAIGGTLTAQPRTWTPGTAFSYQWLADDVVIDGAIAETLVLAPEHEGKAITVKVTGALPGHITFTETSTATSKAVTSASPTITGEAKVGATLAVDHEGWSSSVLSFSYQWYADGDAISGATGRTVVVTADQAGQALAVRVTSAELGYAAVTEESEATLLIATSAVPVIVGEVVLGNSLSADPGVWTPGTEFSFQWHAGGAEIDGATDSTLFLGDELIGLPIVLSVTGRLAGFTTVMELSTPTPPVVAEG